MKPIHGLREIVDRYDTFLMDMWGVLHDGTRPYDGVVEALQGLRAAQKRVVVLSNSSRRTASSIESLTHMGLDVATDIDAVVTSGEVACQLLSSSSPCFLLDRFDGDR